jgi:SpoVK/Ycf46/Vps4 family AAA+-type ATPase
MTPWRSTRSPAKLSESNCGQQPIEAASFRPPDEWDLPRNGATGDRSMLASTVEAMVAEEKSRSHHVLADRLHRALQTVGVTTSNEMRRPQTGGRDFVIESEPRVRLDDLILPLPADRVARQLIEEQNRADLLRAQGMQPRHSVLLSGPPGNGKTSLAEAIAEAVVRPLLTVRYDALVGAYLGETNARLAKLFEYARATPASSFLTSLTQWERNGAMSTRPARLNASFRFY